jgi:hypothetical protein
MAPDDRQEHRRGRLFKVGALTFSQGIERLVDEGRLAPTPYIARHLRGDWGDVTDEQWQHNNGALTSAGRFGSYYVVTRELKICVVTEADRSATHVVLPAEL